MQKIVSQRVLGYSADFTTTHVQNVWSDGTVTYTDYVTVCIDGREYKDSRMRDTAPYVARPTELKEVKPNA